MPWQRGSMGAEVKSLFHRFKRAFAYVRRAFYRFLKIDGPLFAAAFTHYAFLSFFPLIVFLVTIASGFIDRNRAATRIIRYVEQFIPIGPERKAYVFDMVTAVIDGREEAGSLALVLLLWSGSRFLSTLVRATNRAWGGEAHHWWRLPLKGIALLFLLTAVAFLSIAIPAILRISGYLPGNGLGEWVYTGLGYTVRFAVTFLATALFYKLAPRSRISFAAVWPASIATVGLLQVLNAGFGLYLRDFASLNAVYGGLGSIIALLLWIYFSACIFIFGACLCAVQSPTRADETDRDRGKSGEIVGRADQADSRQ